MLATTLMIRDSAKYMTPKALGMVEFGKVTKFVNDDVIGNL
ncbi:MAG: hypothetical protein UY39_C0049G0001 [Candidatus Kaiserbacteria bacterium GW2011_GWC2_49_12]|uniref:Uncharacterized protein n=1 Tax=Candidatus Kaiserbacteria bacterium GW2011_GWC2_49_12 TaxID=1618675 RepID=A0A0G1YHD5_9BACT|nr:MAG: hypothetical protein UY39_C0049G0001 [Candidatus Kaiserbacteria bacterium GW2011_GWC2_49_12]